MKTERRIKKAEAIGILVVLLLFGYLIQGFFQTDENAVSKDSLRSLTEGWYQMVDGKRVELTLPRTVEADENGLVILYNTSLTRAYRGKVLSVRGLQYDTDVWLGRHCLYRYEDNGFEKNSQMKGKIWADAYLTESVGKDSLSLVMACRPGQRVYVQAPLVGTASAITERHLQDAAVSILVIFGMMVFGVVSLIVYFYTRHYHITERRFLDAALFMILCGIWCGLDSGLYQIYGMHTAAGTLLSFYAFMLMSVPMLHFVQDTVSERVKYVPEIWLMLLYANAILQGIFYLAFEIPFIRMLPVTHILLISGVASMIALLVKEYHTDRRAELAACLRAFSALGVSGIAALALYWSFSIHWYDMVFQFGILLFIAILFWFLLRKISGDIRFRVEQTVYERISREDRMTGLKNQKAFESYLSQIETDEVSCENALLLFIDITELKWINDTQGLNRGDETVIRIARCIQNVAAPPFEQSVECFRIDGNEFAVVVLNPSKRPETWEAELKKEMEQTGKLTRLGFGYSYLRRYDGSQNTISDWKNKADSMLRGNY